MPDLIHVRVTLRVARGAPAQQREIDAWLARPDGSSRSDAMSDARDARHDATGDARRGSPDGRELAILVEGAFFELVAPPPVALIRLAAGCVCCVGWLPLRVHLQRAVRAGARSVLLLVAADEHLPRVRDMLLQPQPGISIRLEDRPSRLHR